MLWSIETLSFCVYYFKILFNLLENIQSLWQHLCILITVVTPTIAFEISFLHSHSFTVLTRNSVSEQSLSWLWSNLTGRNKTSTSKWVWLDVTQKLHTYSKGRGKNNGCYYCLTNVEFIPFYFHSRNIQTNENCGIKFDFLLC